MSGAARTARRLGALVLGLALAVAPGCLCRGFLYHPTHADLPRVARASDLTPVHLPVAAGIRVVGLVRAPHDPRAPWLLVFGGNATSLLGDASILRLVAGDDDVGLAAFAYRGYDGSGGDPTEPALFHDADAEVHWLVHARGVSPSRLVIVGYSLGSGVAAHAARVLDDAGTPPRGLALVSAYTSIARVFDDHVPVVPCGFAVPDKYETIDIVPRLRGPVVLVHGTDDHVIPIRHARKLAKAFGARARLVVVQGRGHDDIWGAHATVRAVRSLLGGSLAGERGPAGVEGAGEAGQHR